MYYNVIQERSVNVMTVSLRLNEDDTNLIKSYAKMKGLTISELFRKSVLEKIEDELDLKAYEKAMEEYKDTPVTYSLEEVAKELDLF